MRAPAATVVGPAPLDHQSEEVKRRPNTSIDSPGSSVCTLNAGMTIATDVNSLSNGGIAKKFFTMVSSPAPSFSVRQLEFQMPLQAPRRRRCQRSMNRVQGHRYSYDRCWCHNLHEHPRGSIGTAQHY